MQVHINYTSHESQKKGFNFKIVPLCKTTTEQKLFHKGIQSCSLKLQNKEQQKEKKYLTFIST
jgi:hypothetical protein